MKWCDRVLKIPKVWPRFVMKQQPHHWCKACDACVMQSTSTLCIHHVGVSALSQQASCKFQVSVPHREHQTDIQLHNVLEIVMKVACQNHSFNHIGGRQRTQCSFKLRHVPQLTIFTRTRLCCEGYRNPLAAAFT